MALKATPTSILGPLTQGKSIQTHLKVQSGKLISFQKKKIIFLHIKPVIICEVCSNYTNTGLSFSGLWKEALTWGDSMAAERDCWGKKIPEWILEGM